MTMTSSSGDSKSDLKFYPSEHFSSHEFTKKLVEGSVVRLLIFKMVDSIFVWIGDDSVSMNSMSVCYTGHTTNAQLSNTIFQNKMVQNDPQLALSEQALSKKLMSKLGIAVFISLSIGELSPSIMRQIEEALFTELANKPEAFK